jgi:two-component system, response regulator RpfG
MNVLIVDDQPSQRTMFRHLVEDIGPDVRVTDFGDPLEALSWSQVSPPDLLLLDYRMPKLDGLEFARRFRQPLSHRDVPIVLITVVSDEPIRNAALEAGVIDFLVKPVRPRELRSRCRNLLMLRQQQQTLKSRTYDLERRLLMSMREIDDREREVLHRLARATEYRDHSSGLHLDRMARYAGLIAEALGLPDEEVRVIELAAPLHDIGKIGLPDAVVRKHGVLSPEETELMRSHPRIGHDILAGSTSRFVQLGATIALRHHERWDGSGYPDGMAGRDIPIAARIVGVADVLDALTTPRTYREAWSLDRTIEYLLAESGGKFDPEVVAAVVSRRDQIEEVCLQLAPRNERGG